MGEKFLIFGLGQTLINKWKFIKYFDKRVFEQMNGFGARIDFKNYMTLRNDIIQTRKILTESFEEMISEICKLTLPIGYEKIILRRIQSELSDKEKKYSYVSSNVRKILEKLSEDHSLGIISYNSTESIELLKREEIYDFFEFIFNVSGMNNSKADERVILCLVKQKNIITSNCVMIGDRLNTDIYYGNRLGMNTIRITDSIFSLQSPRNSYEIPCFTVKNLKEALKIIKNLYS